jgi:tetratricopeptide (TPR) repeat protein
VAARLQAAAQPGETLLDTTTLRLAGAAVEADQVEPLGLKGKAEPVAAWRLIAVSTAGERSFDSPLVGREQELRTLSEAWDRVRSGPACQLVTVVGSAGVGKSRLVAEFFAGADATVVRGRCLSYGEGITYWPVVEVLKQLEPQRSRVELDPVAAEALDVVLGGEGTSSPDEIAWAIRKLLEAVAAETPLVAVFDDIQWAEDVLLDLLEHVAFLSTGAPILLLCMARPELLDRRSGWGGVLRLQPLGPDEAETLMETRIGGRELGADVRARILRAAGGNPLFVEEMTAMVHSSGDGIEVPPTLQALLAARLDQLDAPERSVLERGAVEGEVFHHGVVQALTPDEPRLTTQLTALVRKELIRPDRAVYAGDDAFRFRHLLMRDAAYDALPKAERAELHEQFADWLVEHGTELVELDELLGYHLEQAYRYRLELGIQDEHGRALSARAGERLALAGVRAVERQDFRAGLALLERAADLLPDERRDGRFEVDLGWARFFTGQGAEAVLSGLAEAADRASASGDRITELGLRLDHAGYEVVYEPTEGATKRLRTLVDAALPELEAAGNEWGLTMAFMARTLSAEQEGAFGEMASAAEHVVELALRTDNAVMVNWAIVGLVAAHDHGATPVEECLRWLEEHPEVELRSVLPRRDRLLAMLGRFDEAHELQAKGADRVAELGVARLQSALAWRRFDVAMLEGDPARAEAAARETCEIAQATGELGNYMWFCSNLAHALLELDRDDEAEQCLERGLETAPSEERGARMVWLQARAKVLARRGELEEGERLARDAVALGAETDMLNAHADALLDLAEVLRLAGEDGRRAELELALDLYERKGNLVMAQRTKENLAQTKSPF